MRFVFSLILSLAVSIIYAQNPFPRASIILSDHTATDFKEAVGILSNSEGIDVTRHQNPVITFQYTTEENRIEAMHELYSRDFNVTTKSGLPVDFPILAPNATDEQILEYDQQKAEWIEANPERYEEMLEVLQQNQDVTIISQEEFDNLPDSKQQFILENPDQFIVE